MGLRNYALGTLTVLAIGTACAAVASPAWATEPGTEAKPACQLVANRPGDKPNLNGVGKRGGCSDIVTYFWVRVYKVIKLFSGHGASRHREPVLPERKSQGQRGL